jgi:hypothetical protein
MRNMDAMPDEDLLELLLWFHRTYDRRAPVEVPAHVDRAYADAIIFGDLQD